MKLNFKAALLSALVFPGLGQLSKGNRIKGIILFICVNMLLLVVFCLVLQQLLPLLLAGQGKSPVETTGLLAERLRAHGAAIRIFLGGLIGLWFYGWIDALLEKKERE